jgi:hypothetical protein
VAFSFLLMDVMGILVFMGLAQLKNITLRIFSSLASSLSPRFLVHLMGG